MILVTTSDYYPKLGGLSTFTKNIEKVLSELGLEYEIFHWKNRQDIQKISFDKIQNYSHVINIHPQFCWEQSAIHQKTINFIHGSEGLMTSPNFLKRLVKAIRKKSYFKKLEQSYFNIFISEATFKKTIQKGYSEDYSRDLIIHNCIDTTGAKFIEKNISSEWVFSCIVRDVPHKNLQGTLAFCELLSKFTNKKIELIVPQSTYLESSIVKVTKLESSSDDCRNKAYQRSHFNLLFSLDHAHVGYYEGFGLTVLEAAKFGTPSLVLSTGGLPEAVHHMKTGWVFDSIDEDTVKDFIEKMTIAHYKLLANECYKHTLNSHSLNEYRRLLKTFLSRQEAA